ncbi:hypothetical protein BJ085DRAFT_24523 [Dimargaris cristalligena]|uniref:RING-type domain-containing protein n=1 Tax=Dimargaris cristalligena TaxID=215637 RepID=A0A4P9ZXC0_9FUNG|nr:hypothetical protein BJ085DRAFT_24523 [Dimargaris cristalligena]|eukprot:RKP38287.1 hypothetical protein BJ085DRAFT_24523 [Dimargaris cristalligena]
MPDSEPINPTEKFGFFLCDCSICLDDFVVGAQVRVLPCRHYFHSACIDSWLTRKSAHCPLCKFNCKPGAANDEPGPDATSDSPNV